MVRIALVEDDPIYRKELEMYLEKYEKESGENFHISIFTDGDEIVEEYKAIYDIILMDIEMKFMDGMTAAEHIRELDQSTCANEEAYQKVCDGSCQERNT